MNSAITVPADDLAPNNAGPLTVTVLLNINTFYSFLSCKRFQNVFSVIDNII